MVSTLTRIFGVQYLDLAEGVVQEALIKAIQVWPFQGIPDNPSGWIIQVAKNQALDRIRRDRFLVSRQTEIKKSLELLTSCHSREVEKGIDSHFQSLFRDDQLRMMFVCCHPSLSKEARVALTLKTLCGFGVEEIARAFLVPIETIEQRLVRAKRKIRTENLTFEVPEPKSVLDRLESILEVLYLLFNEGYSASHGDSVIRQDLCEEAVRLLSLLVAHPVGNVPKAHALLALMLLQGSRFAARTDAMGELCLLADQDRTRWNRRMIEIGLYHLNASAEGEELSDFHLQASISACHAVAPTFEETNWKQILSDYDELLLRCHTPVISLNRAVALMMVSGPEVALRELEKIRHLPPMRSYYLFPATLAEIYSRMNDISKALENYDQALQLVGTEPERQLLLRKREVVAIKEL